MEDKEIQEVLRKRELLYKVIKGIYLCIAIPILILSLIIALK